MARGHLRARGPGVWARVIELARDPTGKRKQQWHTVHGTKREAERRLRELLTEQDRGHPARSDRLTVAELLDQWAIHSLPLRASPRTRERYIGEIERRLKPQLGAIRLNL